jgi:hypothetical protein
MVRELFVMAREHAPSIIFMDEVIYASSWLQGFVLPFLFYSSVDNLFCRLILSVRLESKVLKAVTRR